MCIWLKLTDFCPLSGLGMTPTFLVENKESVRNSFFELSDFSVKFVNLLGCKNGFFSRLEDELGFFWWVSSPQPL